MTYDKSISNEERHARIFESQREEALSDSIAHWQEIVRLLEAEDIEGVFEEGYQSNSCALCSLYMTDCIEDDIEPCTGCPVMEATGRPGCKDSPYVAFAKSVYIATAASPIVIDHDIYKILADIARRELEFLETLVKKENVQ